MPYVFEALLFLAPFGLYALWLRLRPGRRAVATHVLALALLGILSGIGGAIWYGLSRSMDPSTAYVPARATPGGIERGHSAPAHPPRPAGPGLSPPPPHEGPGVAR